MNWPDPRQLRRKRKHLRLTQQRLAQLSGVSQSVISKIEDSKIEDPSYSAMSRLFRALDQFGKDSQNQGTELSASDLMNTEVVTVKPTDRVKDAWTKMKKGDFSQLPVVDDFGRIVGGVTETNMMFEAGNNLVKDSMGDHFPIVSRNTGMTSIAEILKAEKAVLVAERGKMIGIITAYDLIENAYRKKPESLK